MAVPRQGEQRANVVEVQHGYWRETFVRCRAVHHDEPLKHEGRCVKLAVDGGAR